MSIENVAIKLNKSVSQKSDSVEYTPPIILRDKKQPTKALIYYVSRSNGERDIWLKVFRESQAGNELPQASLSLNGDEIQKLLEYVSQAKSLKELPQGKYLAVPLDGTGVSIAGYDATSTAKAMMNILSKPEVIKHISSLEVPSSLVEALHYGERFKKIKEGFNQLKLYLDDNESSEGKYQEWLNNFGWALGGLQGIRQIDRNHKLDGLMKTYTGFCDIIELKRPNMEVLVWDESHAGYYFHKEVSPAIGQTVTYLERLHDVARTGLEDKEEIEAFYPHGTIVIGRSNNWNKKQHKSLQALNGHLHRIRIITFDHLLKICGDMLHSVPQTTKNP